MPFQKQPCRAPVRAGSVGLEGHRRDEYRCSAAAGGRRLNEGSSRCCLARPWERPADRAQRSTRQDGRRALPGRRTVAAVWRASRGTSSLRTSSRSSRRLDFERFDGFPLVSRRSSRSRSLSSAGIACQCWCRVHATCPTVSAIPSGPTLRNSPSFIHTIYRQSPARSVSALGPRGSPRRIWAGLEGRGSRLEGFERPPRLCWHLGAATGAQPPWGG
jgi:hypothetical protein